MIANWKTLFWTPNFAVWLSLLRPNSQLLFWADRLGLATFANLAFRGALCNSAGAIFYAYNAMLFPFPLCNISRNKRQERKNIQQPGLICLFSADDGDLQQLFMSTAQETRAGLRPGRQADAMGKFLWA